MKKNYKLYVAYGSNLNMRQMAHRCPEATIVGTGVLKNYSLTFWGNDRRSNGVATVLPGAAGDVPVAVWKVSANDEKNLDVYEGYPHLYRKEDIEVVMDNGTVVTAMVYIMNKDFGLYGGEMDSAMPSEYYYGVIAEGYHDFKLDLDFLKAARTATWHDVCLKNSSGNTRSRFISI